MVEPVAIDDRIVRSQRALAAGMTVDEDVKVCEIALQVAEEHHIQHSAFDDAKDTVQL